MQHQVSKGRYDQCRMWTVQDSSWKVDKSNNPESSGPVQLLSQLCHRPVRGKKAFAELLSMSVNHADKQAHERPYLKDWFANLNSKVPCWHCVKTLSTACHPAVKKIILMPSRDSQTPVFCLRRPISKFFDWLLSQKICCLVNMTSDL